MEMRGLVCGMSVNEQVGVRIPSRAGSGATIDSESVHVHHIAMSASWDETLTCNEWDGPSPFAFPIGDVIICGNPLPWHFSLLDLNPSKPKQMDAVCATHQFLRPEI